MRWRCAFFAHRCVLLCNFVEMAHTCIDFIQPLSLLSGAMRDFRDAHRDLVDPVDDLHQRVSNRFDHVHALINVMGRVFNQPLYVCGSDCGSLCQGAHFGRHDRKAFTRFARAGRFHPCIERGDVSAYVSADCKVYALRLLKSLEGTPPVPWTTTPIAELPDAMRGLKDMQSGGVDLFGGYRPLTRRALADIIEVQTQMAVDKYLDGLDNDEIVGRRNGTYRRHLPTALGDIELNVPRTRRYYPTEVPCTYARHAAEVDRLIAAGLCWVFRRARLVRCLSPFRAALSAHPP